jgi:hypothetical protein
MGLAAAEQRLKSGVEQVCDLPPVAAWALSVSKMRDMGRRRCDTTLGNCGIAVIGEGAHAHIVAC